MKKIFSVLILVLLLILTGCSLKRDTLHCNLNDEKFDLVFENGKIVKYLDHNNKEQSSDIIEEMNTYLKDSSNNKEAINTIKTLVISSGGDCN